MGKERKREREKERKGGREEGRKGGRKEKVNFDLILAPYKSGKDHKVKCEKVNL